MKRSIRTRLIANFIVLAVVPLLAFGGIMAWQGFSLQSQNALALQREIAAQTAARTDEYIRGLKERLVQAEQVSGILSLDPERQRMLLLSLMQFAEKPFAKLSLMDHTGQELVRISQPVSAEEEATADRSKDQAFLIPAINLTDYYGPVRFDLSTGEPFMPLSLPLFDVRDESLKAVLYAEITLKPIWDMVTTIGRQEAQSVYVLDKEGRVVTHANPSVVLAETWHALPDNDGLGTGLDGEKVIMAMKRVDLGTQELVVVAELNASAAFSSARQSALIVLALVLAAAGLAGLLAIVTIKRTVHPIQDLSETARAVRDGDITRRAVMYHEDEIGVLATTFNTMTARLAETLGGLQLKISEQSSTQAKLRESEQKYRAVFEQAAEGILITDSRWTIMDANPRAEDLLGYSTEELRGRNGLDLLLEEDRPPEPQIFLNRVLSGEVLRIETRFCKRDGECIIAEMGVNDIGDGRIQILFRNITERKRTEQALDHQIQFLEALLAAVPYPIFYKDHQGRYLGCNNAFEKSIGFSAEQLRGRTVHELYPGEHADIYNSMDLDLIRNQGVQNYEGPIRHATGEIREALFSKSTFKDSNGNVAGIVGVVIDITDQKKNEEMLRLAKKAAEEANQSKSQFLANMSHEIRTPLSCVIGMSELALEDDLEPDLKESMEMILDGGLTLLDIINDILDFTKIETKGLELACGPLDLELTVKKTLRAFSAQANRRKLVLEHEFAPGIPARLKGDPVRLGQIIRNLVGNALKFTEQGGITVLVEPDPEAGPLDEGYCGLRISVSDTGIGIPKDKLDSLFDSFSQVDSSPSKRFPGTGLGLAISKKLVEMMNGRIWVESDQGKGSTFRFTAILETLPVEEDEIPREGDSPKIRDPKEALKELPPITPLNILFAEDNKANKIFISNNLKSAGHSVTAVSNGRLALEALEAQTRNGPRFDLVLMDIQMPEMDGLEATRHIRNHDGSSFDPEIPIVALTAYAMKGDEKRFTEAGMNGYVTKPVDWKKLFSTLHEVAGKSGDHSPEQ